MQKRKPQKPQKRQKSQQSQEVTTVEDAAKRLRIGRNQAYEAAKRGDLPVLRMGRRYLVITAGLDAMLSAQAAESLRKAK